MPFVRLIESISFMSETGFSRSYNVPRTIGNTLTEIILPRSVDMVCVKDSTGRILVSLALAPMSESDLRPQRSVNVGELSLSNVYEIAVDVRSSDDIEDFPDKLYALVTTRPSGARDVRPFAACKPASGETVSLSVPRGVEVDDVELWFAESTAFEKYFKIRAAEGGVPIPSDVLWAASPDPACLMLNELMATCDRSRRITFNASPCFPEGCSIRVVGRIVVPIEYASI